MRKIFSTTVFGLKGRLGPGVAPSGSAQAGFDEERLRHRFSSYQRAPA